MVDEIELTLPADEALHGVANLVLAGLAMRLDLTYETLEDLELGLETLLERVGEDSDEISVHVRVDDDAVTLSVGPFDGEDVRRELERTSDEGLDLRRILNTVADDIRIADGDGGARVSIAKRVQRPRETSSP